jgi:hypothetical protein
MHVTESARSSEIHMQATNTLSPLMSVLIYYYTLVLSKRLRGQVQSDKYNFIVNIQ